jgi:hypothetical protein
VQIVLEITSILLDLDLFVRDQTSQVCKGLLKLDTVLDNILGRTLPKATLILGRRSRMETIRIPCRLTNNDNNNNNISATSLK